MGISSFTTMLLTESRAWIRPDTPGWEWHWSQVTCPWAPVLAQPRRGSWHTEHVAGCDAAAEMPAMTITNTAIADISMYQTRSATTARARARARRSVVLVLKVLLGSPRRCTKSARLGEPALRTECLRQRRLDKGLRLNALLSGARVDLDGGRYLTALHVEEVHLGGRDVIRRNRTSRT